jgi:hypothetical protein
MKKLDKKTIELRDTLAEDLNVIGTEVELAVDKYNAKVNEIKEWASEVASDIDSFMSDKSEKWQEGERGQAYEEWKSSYENFDLEELDVDVVNTEEIFMDLEEEVSV